MGIVVGATYGFEKVSSCIHVFAHGKTFMVGAYEHGNKDNHETHFIS
jgi:hypothetical protein